MRKDEEQNNNNENVENVENVEKCINNEPIITSDKSYSELESQLVNKDIEIQELKQQIIDLTTNNEEKDKLIRAQASQLNLQITKNNKQEITIDALQDKLLLLINSINK